MNEADLLAIFKAELNGELKRATELILKLENQVGDQAILESLMREFHTIKGAARAIQFEEIKNVAHQLEDIYHSLLEGKIDQRPVLIDLTLYSIDLLQEILACSLAEQALPDYQGFEALVASYLAGDNPAIPKLNNTKLNNTELNNTNEAEKKDLTETQLAATNVGNPNQEISNEDLENANDNNNNNNNDNDNDNDNDKPSANKKELTKNEIQPASEPQATQNQDNVDVVPTSGQIISDEQLMDHLFNLSAEITIAVGSFDPQRDAMRKIVHSLNQVQRDLIRGGQKEFADTLQPIINNQNEAIEILDGTDNRMRFLSEELDDKISVARLVPLDRVLVNYPRMLRDLTQDLGKQCRLTMTGEQTRIDKGVLAVISAPLMHLLRNAIDHGIETTAIRQQQGKDSTGHIHIEVVQLGAQIRIKMKDDGGGINMDVVRHKVIARNDTTAALWDGMSLFEQQQFLFLPGFSLAHVITDVSGRGVGLDVVKANVEKIGGRISIESEVGAGTAFTLELPLTLSMTRCLLVQGGKHPFFGVQHYAFPENDLETIQRIRSEDIRIHEGKETVRINQQTLPLFSFASLMGLAPLKDNLEQKHVMIIGTSAPIALIVEHVLEEQAIVRRRFDDRIGKLPNIDGVSLLRNGSMALIVDIKDLYQTLSDPTTSVGGVRSEKMLESKDDQSKTILVVEDSQTVREVEKHFLESAGYDVATAVDGADGFNKLRTSQFDLVITDVDMPRMNGIELIEKIRSNKKLKQTPIIVVSYKDRDEDKQKALQVGANYYVVKSDFDSDSMLDKIKHLLLEETVSNEDKLIH